MRAGGPTKFGAAGATVAWEASATFEREHIVRDHVEIRPSPTHVTILNLVGLVPQTVRA